MARISVSLSADVMIEAMLLAGVTRTYRTRWRSSFGTLLSQRPEPRPSRATRLTNGNEPRRNCARSVIARPLAANYASVAAT
jgi:hypothetical protein